MYTQCPDCSTAFRVTATVLKQAAGKVRCGGCGYAFNALEYLSESMPEQPAANDVEENLPELKPEPLENDDGLPTSISAEQSAALLKTLDELAGSDIRIEDTGVEWRVLDEEELGDSPVDEILEDSPTPVDQFLTNTPAQIDSPEIFHEDANAQTPVDELRFDDNTPLPDDFDFDAEQPYESPSVEQPVAEEPAAEESEDVVEKVAAEPQPDVDLSEPDEWTDILDEFDDLGAAAALPLDEELAALDEELAEESLEDPELDTIDASGELQLENIEHVDDEPSIADELEAIDADVEIATGESAGENPDVDSLLDMDTQFALQAEAMGIDLSGIHDTVDEEPVAADEPSLDELLSTGDDEDREIDDLLEEELVDEIDFDELAGDEKTVDEDDVEANGKEFADDEAEQLNLIDEAADEALEAEPEDSVYEEPEEDSEAPLDDDAEEDSAVLLEDEPEEEAEDRLDEAPEEESVDEEPVVVPLTDEEQTINRQIDAELMAIAVEDEEGFASTIIIPGSGAEAALLAEKADEDAEDHEDIDDDIEKALKDTSAGFETIIMEGEEIRSGLAMEEAKDEDRAAAAALIGAAAAERESEREADSDGRRWIMILGALVLALVLVLQGVHQKRDVLAKKPAFNNIAGPLYRAIGQPLAPEWDITGWRFEATKGSTDEGDEKLTIYSRLGNKLDEPLPYPIIAISLTDRFEETIGSRILDPSDYLANDLDPRKLVEPGNTFNAVMTITAPDPEATGFKLNVCYRDTGGDLRCAIDDFK